MKRKTLFVAGRLHIGNRAPQFVTHDLLLTLLPSLRFSTQTGISYRTNFRLKQKHKGRIMRRKLNVLSALFSWFCILAWIICSTEATWGDERIVWRITNCILKLVFFSEGRIHLKIWVRNLLAIVLCDFLCFGLWPVPRRLSKWHRQPFDRICHVHKVKKCTRFSNKYFCKRW